MTAPREFNSESIHAGAPPTLLVIDDERLILDCIRFTFPRDEMRILTASSAAEGLEMFAQQRPDVVMLDLRLPDMRGLDAFRRLHEVDSKVPVILMTGFGTAETAIEAMRAGAYEYLLKPLDPDALIALVGRALDTSRLLRVPAVIDSGDEGSERDQDARVDLLVGQSPAMQEVYRAIGRVAPRDVTVLIQGESGTGKEVVARAIYHYSRRSAGPFLAINCAAIPETLLESELFGHERGSFTGAERRRIGKFEQCHLGTLFLDEIGDMPILTQTKILRVLQEQKFERLGDNETIHADVRLIAATHRDLEKLMATGQFRADLYYRLNVFTIRLPALRERATDIPLLVDHFLRRFSRELGKQLSSVAPETMELLCHYAWPGNVRELQSVLKQSLLQSTGPRFLPEFLPPSLRGDAARASHARVDDSILTGLTHYIRGRLHAGATELHTDVIALVERQLLSEVLHHTGGNLSQASRILGITRVTLRARLASLGLASDSHGSSGTATDEHA